MAEYVLEVEGRCPVCEQPATFASKDAWLRDHFLCLSCGSQPRERALFSVLAQLRPDWRKLAIHESSPGTAASRRLADQAPGYLASVAARTGQTLALNEIVILSHADGWPRQLGRLEEGEHERRIASR